ncbi:MAG: mismatch-specific DNA-glycosylase [Candidatus Micrarchaeaceae archaeon]
MIRYLVPKRPSILFVGINPHFGSYSRGVPFSNNKSFWYLLNASGLIKESRETLKDDAGLKRFYLLKFSKRYNYGFVNLVDRPTRSTASLRRGEEKYGVERVRRLIAIHKPIVVCFIGKVTFAKFSGSKKFGLGFQQRGMGSSKVFVSSFPIRGPAITRIKEFRMLGRLIRKQAQPFG